MRHGTTAAAASAWLVAMACAFGLMSTADQVYGHCDTTAGPVIVEAKAALEKGDVTPVLKWVSEESEAEIKTAFAKAIAVRSKGPEAKEVADRYFLETLVRLHRAGEGEPYAGIKDEPPDPIVAMADKALVDGSADEMIAKISAHMAEAIREKFNKVRAAREKKDESVEAGREFVEAYVVYMHFVEGIHTAMMASPGGHHVTAPESGHQEHKR
jgi:hypothetical protein